MFAAVSRLPSQILEDTSLRSSSQLATVATPVSHLSVDDRERMPTPECSVATHGQSSANSFLVSGTPGQGQADPPPLPPKPGSEEPHSMEFSDSFIGSEDDDLDDMTEMKPASLPFAELPSSVYPALHPDMIRHANLSLTASNKSSTMPARSKARSQSSGLSIESTDEPLARISLPCSLQRCSSVPTRRRHRPPNLEKLSNRARLLPQDVLDLDEVSLLSDYNAASSIDPGKMKSKPEAIPASGDSDQNNRDRCSTTDTLYIVPPLAVDPPPELCDDNP